MDKLFGIPLGPLSVVLTRLLALLVLEGRLVVGQPFRDLVHRRVRAKGTHAYSAWRPSIRWPKIQPPPPVQMPYFASLTEAAAAARGDA
jgi:hypothetical protein